MCSLSLVPVLVSIHKIILLILLCIDLCDSDCSKCSCVHELRGPLLRKTYILAIQLHILLDAIWCIPEEKKNLFRSVLMSLRKIAHLWYGRFGNIPTWEQTCLEAKENSCPKPLPLIPFSVK